jgi:peroxiredoxin Q/BCP
MAVKVGQKAPDFTAVTDSGETVRLSDFRGKKVVLYFYPRDNTPGCTRQACGFRDNHAALAKAGAVVLGVSPDSAKSHQGFREKHGLPFTLLVDQDHKIAQRYGAWGEKTMYGKKSMGMIRSHFVIDGEGKILDAQPKVSPEESVARALEALGAQSRVMP